MNNRLWAIVLRRAVLVLCLAAVLHGTYEPTQGYRDAADVASVAGSM